MHRDLLHQFDYLSCFGGEIVFCVIGCTSDSGWGARSSQGGGELVLLLVNLLKQIHNNFDCSL